MIHIQTKRGKNTIKRTIRGKMVKVCFNIFIKIGMKRANILTLCKYVQVHNK